MAAGSGGNLQHGPKLSLIAPAFLHSNSTSHTWPFSALAELVDNAYDPDVAAKRLSINVEDRMAKTCLIFTDNGNGMTPDTLHKMLSFGYSEKVPVGKHKPVGRYGNGFKSGSMRLADDAIVFTKNTETMSVGFLSQSYLKAINATTVLIPMVTWNIEGRNMVTEDSLEASLDAITQHSLFPTEEELLTEFEKLSQDKTGTRIILFNLKRGTDDKLELDFESDSKDIINSERQEVDPTVVHQQVFEHVPEHVRSLREYLSILFLKPRMKIMLRDCKVKTKLVSKSLSNTENDYYKPHYLDKSIKITFGFNSSKHDFGMMMYHKNRLIKAYEHVGIQKQANELGVGVVGVVEVDFLEPVHNKQDFNKTDRYNTCIAALSSKLKDYWETKTTDNVGVQKECPNADWTWVNCDNENCQKWRRLPKGCTDEGLPDKWFCHMNPDHTHNRCDIEEELQYEDEYRLRASYNKVKKKSAVPTPRKAKKKIQLPGGDSVNITHNDTTPSSSELVSAKEKSQLPRSDGVNITCNDTTPSSSELVSAKEKSQLPRSDDMNITHNDTTPSSSELVSAKEKSQLPCSDDVNITRNDTTPSSSDVEIEKKEIQCLDSDVLNVTHTDTTPSSSESVIAKEEIQLPRSDVMNVTHTDTNPSSSELVIAKEEIQLPSSDAVNITRNDTTPRSSDLEIEKKEMQFPYSDVMNVTYTDATPNSSKLVIAKRKIQLSGGDSASVTRIDTTPNSSDTEEETPRKRQKRAGLDVKVPIQPIISEPVVIDSDDDSDPIPSTSKEKDISDVKQDIEVLKEGVEKEQPGTPKRSSARIKNRHRQIQADLSDGPPTSTENGNVKDMTLQQLETVKSQLENALQQLETVKSQLASLRSNVLEHLHIVMPDLVVDDLEYVDVIVREMVRVNKEKSTEDGTKPRK